MSLIEKSASGLDTICTSSAMIDFRVVLSSLSSLTYSGKGNRTFRQVASRARDTRFGAKEEVVETVETEETDDDLEDLELSDIMDSGLDQDDELNEGRLETNG